jgi:hypothetical protein
MLYGFMLLMSQTKTESTALHELAPGMASGLFGFLQSYGQNTLTMFGSSTLGTGVGAGALSSAAPGVDASRTSESTTKGATTATMAGEGTASSPPSTSAADDDAKGDVTTTAENAQDTTARVGRRNKTQGSPRMYPRSTLLFVALIAFLLGSLLRSLLSPADFIYVITDAQDDSSTSPASSPALSAVTCPPAGAGVEVPGTCGPVGSGTAGSTKSSSKALELAQSAGVGVDGSGWREIRRLLEIKYLVGGWDFQVAVVRRH